jgi:hypothetical protein
VSTAFVLTLVVAGALMRLYRIYRSHAPLIETASLTLLVAVVVLIAIRQSRRHTMLCWPPKRETLVGVFIAVTVAICVDLPGYAGTYSDVAEARVLARQSAHIEDSGADQSDGIYIAFGDDTIGLFTRYSHLWPDIETASRASANDCPAAIEHLDRDERGFRETSMRSYAVDEAIARGRCAYLSHDRADARQWFQEAARRYERYSAALPSAPNDPRPDVELALAADYAQRDGDREDAALWRATWNEQVVDFRRRHPCHRHGAWAC